MELVFEANSLSKSYGKNIALDKLCMKVPAGAIYGFVGKNGAGKTTLLRLLCTLQYPTGGDFSLFGVNSTDKSFSLASHRIGALVEAPALYMDMTAEENLRQQYRILGLDSFDSVGERLRLVGLEETGRKKVRHFSQGMRQKLAIAIALAGEPELLVLDEPVNGLDPQGIIDLRELLLRLNREKHITVLISSHILSELSLLATHYGFIDHGRMIREMTAQELEQARRKATRVEVSDVRKLARALDRMGLEYHVLSEIQAEIFARLSLTRLAVELVKEDCEIYYSWETEESVEDYFIELIGGESDVRTS